MPSRYRNAIILGALFNGVGHIYLGQRLFGAMILSGTIVWIAFSYLYLPPTNPLAYAAWAIWFVQLVHLVMLVQRLKRENEASKTKMNEGWETK